MANKKTKKESKELVPVKKEVEELSFKHGVDLMNIKSVHETFKREEIAIEHDKAKFIHEIKKFAVAVASNSYHAGVPYILERKDEKDLMKSITWTIPCSVKNVRRLNRLKNKIWNRTHTKGFKSIDDGIEVNYCFEFWCDYREVVENGSGAPIAQVIIYDKNSDKIYMEMRIRGPECNISVQLQLIDK